MRLPGFAGRSASPKPVAAPHLNLYPEDPFFESPIGRVMRWAVGAGRHIIIFTELVVIVSFLSRFVLDRQLTDLNDSIVQKQAIVQSYGDLESQFRTAQQQQKDIEEILKQQNKIEVLGILSEVTPPTITYSSVSLSGGSVTLEGTTPSLPELIQLVDNVKLHPAFQRVSVGRLESGDKRETSLRFTMNLIYTKGLVEFGAGQAAEKGAGTTTSGANLPSSSPATTGEEQL